MPSPVEILLSAPGWAAGNVLDVRPLQAFKEGHLAGSAHHPLEAEDPAWTESGFLERELPSIFLPPRHEPLVVIGSRAPETELLAAHLAGRGRARVTPAVWTRELAAGLPADLNKQGTSNRHLWKPPLWLARHEDLLPPPAAGPVLDLACGSGRAAVWLAERGYRVTGIDWQTEALELGARLAASRRVSCRFLAQDLRRSGGVPPGPWAVILNFRFRHPDLLEKIPRWLQPGGVALVRTFRDAPGYDGHPHPRYRLEPQELLKYFPAGACEILAHEESHDPDGRPAAGIVARKKFP
jgi:hypothetical protein